MAEENHDDWPYDKIEHWPPMTYRNLAAPTEETLKAFTDFLEKENSKPHKKQLQPWIPFCEGKYSFCYFPVDCGKQDIKPYITALKRALTVYAKSNYVQSSVFDELYIGGGSPTYLEPNNQATQKETEEVYPQITTPQPKQHTNNANTKHKKPQTAPHKLVHPKPNTTTNKTTLQPNSSSMQKPIESRGSEKTERLPTQP